MCLGTFSRRGAVALATIYPCAECASSRSVFIVWKQSFLYDSKSTSTFLVIGCGAFFSDSRIGSILLDMFQSLIDDRADMSVRQGIKDGFAFSSAFHQFVLF